MDIYRFVDSRDIREHLKQLDYQFTTPETAFLVWYCHTATLDEKIAAWQEIIDTMPNCSMGPRRLGLDIPDFHEFLRRYINLQMRYLKQFRDATGGVYSWRALFGCREENVSSTVYASYCRCLDAAKDWAADDDGCTGFIISKNLIDTDQKRSWADSVRFNRKSQIVDVHCFDAYEEDSDLSIMFTCMWFAFPTPFHVGDIVCNVDEPNDPFVLSTMKTWGAKQASDEFPQKTAKEAAAYDRLLAEHEKDGDISDMMCYGYSMWDQRENGGLFVAYVDGVDYLDIELARDPLKGTYQPLKAISYYLKQCRAGKPILIDTLLNSYAALVSKALYESMHSWVESSIGYRWIDDLTILSSNPNG